MKLKNYIIGAICVMSASCEPLDLAPIDEYGISNFWKSEEQCERFIVGAHYHLKTKMEDIVFMGELRGGTLSEEGVTSIGEGAFNLSAVKNDLTEANPVLTNWCDFYKDIFQINIAIDNLVNHCEFLSENSRNTYLGQMYGLRSFYYFHLLKTFGGVPLCDKPDVLSTGDLAMLSRARSTENEIYDFVRADIDRSCACYSSLPYKDYNNSKGFWNKAASQCLKAEIYMWGAKVKPIKGTSVYSSNPTRDLEAAKQALLEIADLYSLNANYADAFSVKNKDANKETIFSSRVNLGESENFYKNFTYNIITFTKYLDKNGDLIGNVLEIPWGAMRYEYKKEFYDSFEDGDTRRDATLYQFYKKDGNGDVVPAGRCLCKFLGDLKDGLHEYTNDIPVYRYADVALMLAEIYNDLGDGGNVKLWMDKIRKRAGATLPEFTYTTKAAADEAILQERKVEFVAEGKVWYDVRRMMGGKHALDLVMGNELKLLWPIDSGTLTKDEKVKQNEGYVL